MSLLKNTQQVDHTYLFSRGCEWIIMICRCILWFIRAVRKCWRRRRKWGLARLYPIYDNNKVKNRLFIIEIYIPKLTTQFRKTWRAGWCIKGFLFQEGLEYINKRFNTYADYFKGGDLSKNRLLLLTKILEKTKPGEVRSRSPEMLPEMPCSQDRSCDLN